MQSSNKNSKEENVISVPTVPKKEAPQSKRTVKEDDSTEHPFELVTKKKKTKKTMTQREAGEDNAYLSVEICIMYCY